MGRLAGLAGWRRLPDLDADGCRRALASLGVAAGTRRNNHPAARSFCRWCVATRRLAADPLAGLRPPDAAADVRHGRRLAAAGELAALFAYLEGPDAGMRRGLSPAQRALAYRLALYCGLRAGEISRLTRASFDLAARTVTVAAASDKRRRRAVLPLPSWLAEALAAHLDAGGALWGRLRPRSTSRLLAADLAACGVAYEEEGPDGPLFLDFHSLRYWYCTQLAHQPGISPKVMMELARHADPRLTLKVYSKSQESPMRKAVESLPRA
jgi:integrase